MTLNRFKPIRKANVNKVTQNKTRSLHKLLVLFLKRNIVGVVSRSAKVGERVERRHFLA